MHWETRVHWWWGLLLPGRWYFFLIAVAGLGILTFDWWGILTAALLTPIAILGLLDVWVRWRSFSLSISPVEKIIWERHGLVMVVERQINLGFFGNLTFEQTLMGRILDYGSLAIGALGGPYEWDNLGHFRALRRIVESRGEWMPRHRLEILAIIRTWISSLILRVRHLCENIQQTITNHLRQASSSRMNSPGVLNYSSFLRFVERILFSRNTRRFENTVSLDINMPGLAFTLDEVQQYYRILRARRIIVTDSRGHEYLHNRIKTLYDVQRRIPADWFQRAVRSL